MSLRELKPIGGTSAAYPAICDTLRSRQPGMRPRAAGLDLLFLLIDELQTAEEADMLWGSAHMQAPGRVGEEGRMWTSSPLIGVIMT